MHGRIIPNKTNNMHLVKSQLQADVHISHLGVRGGWGVAGASQVEQACPEGARLLDFPHACRLVPGKTLHGEMIVIILHV